MLRTVINNSSYIYFGIVYLLFFCFFFKTKLDTIIFSLVIVTTLFLCLKVIKDIIDELYATNNQQFKITDKYFSFDFIKQYSFIYTIVKLITDIPIFVYIPLSLILIIVSLLLLYTILSSAYYSKVSQSSVKIPLSNIGKSKIKKMKIMFIIDIIFLFILIFITKFTPSEMFSKNKGINMANGMSMLSTAVTLTISSYLIYMSNSFYGLKNQITDGSS